MHRSARMACMGPRTRTRIAFGIAAVVGTAWAVGAESISLFRNFGGNYLLEFLCGLAILLSGLFALYRRRGNRIGWLLVAYGVIYFLEFWAIFLPPVAEALAPVVVSVSGALIAHVAVAYPTGRVVTRFGRAIVVAVYVWNLTLGFLLEASIDRSAWQCDAVQYCRSTLSEWLWPSVPFAKAVLTFQNAGTPVIVALVALAIWQRWRLATRPERLALRPLWLAVIVLGGADVADAVGTIVGLSGRWSAALTDLQTLAQLAAPIVIVYGLIHAQLTELARQNADLAAAVQAQLREVRASRARIVAAGDRERRRVEHNLHDGAQQSLLAVIVALRIAEREAQEGSAGTASTIAQAREELRSALDELRELARGIHPSILTDAGLGPAVRALVQRSRLPIAELDIPASRMPAVVEATAYFLVAESLTNVARHAHASHVTISVHQENQSVRVIVADDGVGGADHARGSGLRGLTDRVTALGGTLIVESPPPGGTVVTGRIPMNEVAQL
jgi:signal transduction histidine kinase